MPSRDPGRPDEQSWGLLSAVVLLRVAVLGWATVVVVTTSSLAGYAYSRFRGHALTSSAFLMIFVRMVPPIIITLPLFPWANALYLNDTRLLLIILYASLFVSLGTWIMKATIDAIPVELDEASIMDGASYPQLLRSIVFPLAAPGMIAAGVFIVVFAWNEFLFAFIFSSTRARTAPMALSEMTSSVTGVDWGVLFAAATLQLLPVLIVVLAAQRYLIAGLSAGSVKG